MTLSLFGDPKPPTVPGIDLRCCGVAELLASGDCAGAGLIVADPPWVYSQAPGVASPDLQYSTMTEAQIADVLADARGAVAGDARLAVWCTWPKLGEFWQAVEGCAAWKWRYKTGGSWHKTPSAGVGYHWLGNSELVLLYTSGSPPAVRWGPLSNAHTSPRMRHSEKPVGWMAGWLERWTDPGDLVVDLFAGLAPMARACHATGRRYIGAEIDPDRHHQAMCRLALARE